MSISTDWRASCEAEPLTLSGLIQPHGALLCLDSEFNVTHVSAQINAYLPYLPSSLLGQKLPEELLTKVLPVLSDLSVELGSRIYLNNQSLPQGVHCDIAVIKSGDAIIIELSKHDEVAVEMPLTSSFRLPSNDINMVKLHVDIANLFHTLTGFDRVMIYAFRDDGDGEVLAEARRSEIYGSYLGLRFPRSDIPAIARALYLQNPWRMIPDSQAEAIPLLGLNESPPDLTWSDLRSVSPMHMVYLSNMAVQASLSFPIIVANQLWGLVACHHAQPIQLSNQTLKVLSDKAKAYGFSIMKWQAESRMRLTDTVANDVEKIKQVFVGLHSSPLKALTEISADLFFKLKACGAAMRFGDEWTYCGETPSHTDLDFLDDWLECEFTEPIYLCDSLIKNHPNLGYLPVSGAMALKVAARDGEPIHLWIFRKELLYEVEWGGNPNKPVEHYDGKFDITPRRSFEKYVEKRLGYCAPWLNETRLWGMRLRHMLFEVYG